MKPFMDADFLLQTDTAKTLYQWCAGKMPIFDYHNYLNYRRFSKTARWDESDTRLARRGSL